MCIGRASVLGYLLKAFDFNVLDLLKETGLFLEDCGSFENEPAATSKLIYDILHLSIKLFISSC